MPIDKDALFALLSVILGGGWLRAWYKGYRAVKTDIKSDRQSVKEDRRSDHTAEFAEKAWTGFIVKLEAEIARKDKELFECRLEIARHEIALDKCQERVHNMLKRHVSGKDVLQTDIGLGAPDVDRIGTAR